MNSFFVLSNLNAPLICLHLRFKAVHRFIWLLDLGVLESDELAENINYIVQSLFYSFYSLIKFVTWDKYFELLTASLEPEPGPEVIRTSSEHPNIRSSSGQCTWRPSCAQATEVVFATSFENPNNRVTSLLRPGTWQSLQCDWEQLEHGAPNKEETVNEILNEKGACWQLEVDHLIIKLTTTLEYRGF